jgi:uncharacterized protein (DUF169 family)
MDYREEAALLKETLSLEREPVAITFTNEHLPDPGHKRVWMCGSIMRASEGSSFVIDAEHSACPGGSWHCGITEPVSGEAKRRLQWFLTKGEKLTHSIVSFERMQKLGSPPPTGMAERIAVTPLREAAIRPDLVIFICNPEQACRLIALDTYWDGIPPRQELTGSLCHTTIAYSAMTGYTNLSLGDWTARHMQKIPADVVFLTVPYERMANLLAAIPECTAGTAEADIPPEFRRPEE